MENVFLDLIYAKEFSKGIINRIKNFLHYRKIIRKLKKEPPSFEIMWQFIEFIRWVDIIYGFNEKDNNDIDLIKKRNPYVVDSDTGKATELSFTINVDERSKVLFSLEKKYKIINIEITRERIPTSENKSSSISFSADKDEYKFTHQDQLIICEINRILQEKMIKYVKMYYNRV